MEEQDAPARACFVALLVLEEVGTNILKYAYPDVQPNGDSQTGAPLEHPAFNLELRQEGSILRMRFVDQGAPFDPTEEARVEETALEEAVIGGRGLLLVQRMSRSMRYQRQDGRNILDVELDLSPAD